MFVDHGTPPSLCNNRKVTPLHMACRFDLPRVAERLAQLGANVDAYDDVRETPLYRAVNLGYAECVQVLLAAGANVDFQNRRDATPLHRAAQRGKRFIAPLLLAAGANPRLVDRAGKTALDYARNKHIRQSLGGGLGMTVLFTHPACLKHEMPGHPERPVRLSAVLDHLAETGLMAELDLREAPPAKRDDLVRVHDAVYLDALERLAPDARLGATGPGYLHGAGVLGGGEKGRWRGDRRYASGSRRHGAARLLRRAPAGPPRRRVGGNGLLPAERRRRRGGIRPCLARHRPRGRPGFRRPPRQRHGGGVHGQSRGAGVFQLPVPALSLSAAGRGAPAHRQHAAAGRYGRRRVSPR